MFQKLLKLCVLLALLVSVLLLGYAMGRIPIPPLDRLVRHYRAKPEPPVVLSTVRVMFPEGCTVETVIGLLSSNGVAGEEELRDAAANADFGYEFLTGESGNPARLEGFLFPDTYEFYQPEDPKRTLNRLLGNFARKLEGWDLSGAESRGYDLNQIVTIASLIEKETDGTDQARIASVIYNRLEGPGDRHGTYGYLQIDASLLYALPGHTGPVTRADLETDSPYNLYKYKGLPPAPIANPGAESMAAALSPEETDYYYYALAKDGRHRFFSQYKEFSAFLKSAEYVGN